MGSCCSKESSEPFETDSLREPSTTPQVITPNQSMEVNISTVNQLPQLVESSQKPLVKIIYAPASEKHQCAYCNDPSGDLYDYFHVGSTMPCTLYEEFMENGWWRTGKLIFRPRFDVVCCPGYATRLPVEEYALTKKHRRTIRKWGAFLRNGAPEWEKRKAISSQNVEEETTRTEGTQSASTDNIEPIEKKSKAKPKKIIKPGLGPDPNKPQCKKSKLRKTERLKTKKAEPQPTPQTNPISLVDLINREITATEGASLKHRFEAQLVPCVPILLQSTNQRAYDLYDKLQKTVHIGKVRFESLDQFTMGFCESCLPSKPGQGSFHLQYFLDGELVMYSIVDITPTYFVSVYFIYDPDLRFLSPGIFTCLYEMMLVQKLKQTLPNMKYYGLGYYNHFDDKASYKRQFKPQQVLCNETNVFVSLESAIPKFLAQKYCRLTDDSVPVKEGRNASIDSLFVAFQRFMSGPFAALSSEDQLNYRESLRQFICEAGSKAAHQCIVDLLSNYP